MRNPKSALWPSVEAELPAIDIFLVPDGFTGSVLYRMWVSTDMQGRHFGRVPRKSGPAGLSGRRQARSESIRGVEKKIRWSLRRL